MTITEVFGVAWLASIAGFDVWLKLSGRETISAMATRLGVSHWWVKLAYAAGLVFLFYHFWRF